jgi:creatinine amidohydrolase/Fe(II)-dependent formamide hydrolase-like protein
MVDEAMRSVLAPVPISLSKKLSEGVGKFLDMGMELAYAGDPAAASVEEGEQLIHRLADMVVGEIREALGLPVAAS